MIRNMMKEGRIYKYVAPARIGILEDLLIRITQPKYLNDWFDIFISIKQIIPKELFDRHLLPKYKNAISKFLDDSTQIFRANLTGLDTIKVENEFRNYFTMENKEAINSLNQELSKKLGVLSFTKSPDNVPMWAHYADSYRGFVIIFNSNHSFFNKGLVKDDKDMGYLDKVIYVEEKKNFESLKDVFDNPKKVFFEKQKSWENENELRMILPLDLATTTKYPDIYLIEIPPELIIGVIFGFDCNPNLIEYVKELKKDKFKDLKLYRAVPNLEKYKMDIVELDKE